MRSLKNCSRLARVYGIRLQTVQTPFFFCVFDIKKNSNTSVQPKQRRDTKKSTVFATYKARGKMHFTTNICDPFIITLYILSVLGGFPLNRLTIARARHREKNSALHVPSRTFFRLRHCDGRGSRSVQIVACSPFLWQIIADMTDSYIYLLRTAKRPSTGHRDNPKICEMSAAQIDASNEKVSNSFFSFLNYDCILI